MDLFPIFLKIAARPCIVIGAGHLAESKIESLRAAHAKVTVIAPEGTDRIAELAAEGEIEWHQREYAAGDLTGNFLVIAATNVPAVNRAVHHEATGKNILCNAVDDPPFCDFYFPSVVRRGDLQIAISTAGASPALAQKIRKDINAQLPLDAGDWLTDLGNLRREVTQMPSRSTRSASGFSTSLPSAKSAATTSVRRASWPENTQLPILCREKI